MSFERARTREMEYANKYAGAKRVVHISLTLTEDGSSCANDRWYCTFNSKKDRGKMTAVYNLE